MAMNMAVLMGNITADPELRTTNSGVAVTSFNVAVARRFKRDETDFIEVQAWRQTAEFITRYFHKGDTIAVRGSIQTNRYEDKNGNKRTSFAVVADEVSFCGKKDPMSGLQNKVKDFNANDDFEEIPVSDDLPF